MRRLLPLALLLSIPIVLSACGGGGGKPSTVSQQVPAAGATVSLGDQVTLTIPPGAVADATKVTITKKNAPGDALPAGQSLGSGYSIDLGGQTLQKPVTLEIAFDPKKLPKDSPLGTAFLAYYDEAKGTWVPAGGIVDTQRNVISFQTDHLSWWNPFSWNWGAWIAVLTDALTGNVTDFLHAVSLLTNDCPQTGPTVSVDSSHANNVIQGCVEHDDPSLPQLRVVNPKSFFYEVKALSGGNGYPPDTMLGPGDDLKFQASTSDPAPLVVQAEITQKAGLYLIVHLIIQMLPGLNELGIQGPQVACITEKLADVSYFVSASEALLVSHDGAAAAEQLIDFLGDGGAVQRFITSASDCNYGAARTWSLEGIKQIGSATATIISATDFVANYLLNSHSQVAFSWTQAPTPTAVPAPSFTGLPFNWDDYAALVEGMASALETTDTASFRSLVRDPGGEGNLWLGGWGNAGAGVRVIPMVQENLDAIFAGSSIHVVGLGHRDSCPVELHCAAYGLITTGWQGKTLPNTYSGDAGPGVTYSWTFTHDEVMLVFWSDPYSRLTPSFYGLAPSGPFELIGPISP